MRSSALLCLALLGLPRHASAQPERPLDPSDHQDRERMATILLRRVAHVVAKPRPRKTDAFRHERRDGFGVAVGPRRVVCLSFIVERAESVTVRGPNGQKAGAKVILYDVERRVAVLEPDRDVAALGLEVVTPARAPERSLDQPLFALSATVEPFLLDGVLTDVGAADELEGLLMSDLKLAGGMPVFDDRARFVGYSRAVEWDQNRLLLISPEVIEAARTATRTPARGEPARTAPPPPEPEPSSGWIRGTKRAR